MGAVNYRISPSSSKADAPPPASFPQNSPCHALNSAPPNGRSQKVGHHGFFQVYESLTAITMAAPLQRAASASR
jgi:hypothetical protein